MKGAQGTSAASSDAVRTIHSILCGERALDMRYSRKTHCTAADAERTAQSGAEAADAGTFHHAAFTCEILRKHPASGMPAGHVARGALCQVARDTPRVTSIHLSIDGSAIWPARCNCFQTQHTVGH